MAAPGCFCLGSALIGAADRSARRALDSIVCIPAPDETLPIVRCATGFHQPLDRLGLRLYISAKRFATQPLVLTICPSSTFSVTWQTELAKSTAICLHIAGALRTPLRHHECGQVWCSECPSQRSNSSPLWVRRRFLHLSRPHHRHGSSIIKIQKTEPGVPIMHSTVAHFAPWTVESYAFA